MQIDKNIPFYANPDKTHCFQACLKMIMKYFWPDKDYSWEELDRITEKSEGKWTWIMAGLIWLKDHGFEVRDIEVFDYKKFFEFGEQYLFEEYGKEVGGAQIKNSNVEKERKMAGEFVKKFPVEKSIPTVEDIKNFLLKGYLVICTVNFYGLHKKEGYSGHAVVLKGFDEEHFIIHDSSDVPNFSVDFDTFEKAWACPNERAKNIIALKLESAQN